MLNGLILFAGAVVLTASLASGVMLPISRSAAEAKRDLKGLTGQATRPTPSPSSTP